MKIVMVGCGALGSYYGARLLQAGQEVHFLLRSDYDVVRRQGVHVHSPSGDFHVQPTCARRPEEIGVGDLVFIGLKTTANAGLASLLPPLVGPQTAVVTLQNGLGNESRLAALFGPGRVLGGLCFVCLNRVAPGIVQHTAYGRIVLGEYGRPPQARTHDIAALLRHAGVPCDVTDSLERARWEKLVWNVPFNGLGVAGAAGYEAVLAGAVPPGTPVGSCLATDVLLGDPRWEGLVRDLMLEIVHAATAKGLPLGVSAADEQMARTRSMGAYRASTLIDFERGLPLEIDSMFFEPLRQARAARASTPRLAALVTVLSALETMRSGRTHLD